MTIKSKKLTVKSVFENTNTRPEEEFKDAILREGLLDRAKAALGIGKKDVGEPASPLDRAKLVLAAYNEGVSIAGDVNHLFMTARRFLGGFKNEKAFLDFALNLKKVVSQLKGENVDFIEIPEKYSIIPEAKNAFIAGVELGLYKKSPEDYAAGWALGNTGQTDINNLVPYAIDPSKKILLSQLPQLSKPVTDADKGLAVVISLYNSYSQKPRLPNQQMIDQIKQAVEKNSIEAIEKLGIFESVDSKYEGTFLTEVKFDPNRLKKLAGIIKG